MRQGLPVKVPLSSNQERVWFLSQFENEASAHHLPLALRLTGPLRLEALESAYRTVLGAHETLRMRVGSADDKPVAIYDREASSALEHMDLLGCDPLVRDETIREVASTFVCRPFDLVNGPLVRAALLKVKSETHVLVVVFHELTSDSFSHALFLQELVDRYRVEIDGGAGLSGASLDCNAAVCEGEGGQSAASDDALRYWRARLSGEIPFLDLPTDRPVLSATSCAGASVHLDLPEAVSERLKDLARNEGVTLESILLAGFAAFLYRHTHQDDLLIGVSDDLRAHYGCCGVIGPLENTLVARFDISRAPTFRDLVQTVSQELDAARAHGTVPFAQLIDALQPEREAKGSPFFRASFEFHPELGECACSGLRFTPMDMGAPSSKYAITLAAFHGPSRLTARLIYRRDLFDPETVVRMASRLRILLEAASHDADMPLSDLPLLTPAERELVVETWNATATAYPRNASIQELFEEQVLRSPEAIALRSGDEIVTYSELNARSNRIARFLWHAGVSRETRVALCMDRGAGTVAAILGVLKAGAAYVPIDPQQPDARLRLILENTSPVEVLSDEQYGARLPVGIAPVVFLDQESDRLLGLSAENLPERSAATDLAYIMYTSGSTGVPKGVCVEHRNVVRLVKNTNYASFGPREVHLLLAPLMFDASTFELWGSLLNGGTLAVAPPGLLSLDEIGRCVQENGVTTLWLTAGLFHQMVDHCLESLRGVRQLLCGGDVLSVPHVKRVLERLPDTTVINGYGPTESTTFACCYPMKDVGEVGETVSIGKPIANTTTYIVGRNFQPVPVGVIGELLIGGDGLARGYLNDPAMTAERFIANPFSSASGERLYKTGDLARYLPDGRIEFLGRRDFQVKVRGFRIELGEIEAALGQHPDVFQTVITVREDMPGDKTLAAYLVPARDKTPDVNVIREHLREKLPEYMVPSDFVVLEMLPLTVNGKVDRRALPAPERTLARTSGRAFVAPQTPMQETLASMWREVLRIDRIGIHDNFFDLGGHSLLATQVISRVRTALQLEVPLGTVFEAPTLAEFAAAVEEALRGKKLRSTEDASQGIPLRGSTGPAPLSFAQEGLWFLERFAGGFGAYNVAILLRLRGALDGSLLRSSLLAVIARHESLRMRFSSRGGIPVQEADPEARLTWAEEDLTSVPVDALRRASAESCRPFDLVAGPPTRATLYRLTSDEHLLCLVIHHIVTDGWSMRILLEELASCYQGKPLPLLPIQFTDYAVWQRSRFEGQVLEERLAYWKGRLHEPLPVLDLPTDRTRPAAQTFRGGQVYRRLSHDLTERLRALSQRKSVTLFVTLLSGWGALLHRYTGQEDLITGSVVAGRTQGELEGLIGYFINTVVLRLDLSGDPDFRTLLCRVRQVAIEAQEHQDTPFDALVAALQPERTSGRSPLFQVMFVFHNTPMPGVSLGSVEGRVEEIHNGGAKFDLTFAITDHSDGLSLSLEYSADLFESSTVARMLEHYEVLLSGAAEHPEERIGALPLLTPTERQLVLETWNATATAYPKTASIQELFEEQVLCSPEAIALRSGGVTVTYGELNARSNRIARFLRDAGVSRESRVALCMDRSAGTVAAILGILKAGAAYVPIDPQQPDARLRLILENTSPVLVLSDERFAARVPAGIAPVIFLNHESDRLLGLSPENLAERPAATDLAYIMYTSGSTGVPKGVCVEHRNVVRLVKNTNYVTRGPQEVHLLLAPLMFDASTFELWGSLLNGGTLAVAPPGILSLDEIGHCVEENGVTTLWLTAGLFHQMVDHCLKSLRGVRQLLCGGDVLSVSHVKRVLKRLPDTTVINGYGPTESTTFACCYPMKDVGEVGETVSIGKPIANTTTYIVDRNFQPVPIGVIGELLIGGDGLARGYLNDPAMTAERFVANPFSSVPGERLYRTGDLTRYLPDGRIEFRGRRDFQVKVRGFRIELGEIEAVLGQHPDVFQTVITVRKDNPGDKTLAAYVVPARDKTPDVNALRQHLREQLPEYMVPSAFVFMEALPLTTNGKVDRRALPEPDREGFAAGAELAEPQTDIEHALAVIWCEVLRIDRIGIHDNFFDLGGHSLLATQVISRVRLALELEVPLRLIFEAPTIATFAALIEEALIDDIETITEDEANRQLAGDGES